MNSKIAIVTGASRGLGRNAALSISKKGFDVIITYNSKIDEANEVVALIEKDGNKAHAIQLNVADTKGFQTFSEEVRGVLKQKWNRDNFDFLINNAGIGLYGSFMETTEETFDQLMNIQFKGVFFLSQKLLPFMKDGGRIINISTGLARFALPGYSAYASMKGAIETLTKYMAKELGPRGISVNVVAPGAIETDFGGGAVRDNKELNAFVASQTALGRAGVPDDIGPLIASLLTEDTRWVNAQRIEASGGMFL